MNFPIAYEIIQIVRYALQKFVKVRCVVQKIQSKFCPLDVIKQPIYCPKTVQKTRKIANMVLSKVINIGIY